MTCPITADRDAWRGVEPDQPIDELLYRMWWTLGTACSDWVISASEDLAELAWVDDCIARAERAETCLHRAAEIRARAHTATDAGGE